MNWYPIWSYHFQNYESLPAESAGMNQIIHFFSPLETKAVRILFSNSQGKDPVLFEQAGIRTDREEGRLQFDGQSRLLLAPGEERGVIRCGSGFRQGKRLNFLPGWKEG